MKMNIDITANRAGRILLFYYLCRQRPRGNGEFNGRQINNL